MYSQEVGRFLQFPQVGCAPSHLHSIISWGPLNGRKLHGYTFCFRVLHLVHATATLALFAGLAFSGASESTSGCSFLDCGMDWSTGFGNMIEGNRYFLDAQNIPDSLLHQDQCTPWICRERHDRSNNRHLRSFQVSAADYELRGRISIACEGSSRHIRRRNAQGCIADKKRVHCDPSKRKTWTI